ncbi:MAG TPA: transcription-repair coupling factor [candidate division WOR-3 bacterium]|uniref:Transcription-repair-coupling factor n=1 Tax=candidate division WOR-3 bacterium TaxID=2052148 RepID=A0A7V0XF26_UNCW3|nr:transcription-repair coupling factor [candidate division WOR-3 bacterium]
MTLPPEDLFTAFAAAPLLGELAGKLAGNARVGVRGVAGAARALLAAAVAERLRRPVALICTDDDERDEALADLARLRPGLAVLAPVPEREDAARVLQNIATDEPSVIVIIGPDLDRPLPSQLPAGERELAVAAGGTATPEAVIAWLDRAGYELVDLVVEPGEFARRGGIVDVFPERTETPSRLEFAGDTVESVRSFDALSQRTTRRVESVTILSRRTPELSNLTVARLLPDRTVLVTDPAGRPSIRNEKEVAERRAVIELTAGTEARFDLGFVEPGSYLGNSELLRSELAASPLCWHLACGTPERCRRLRETLGPGPALLPVSLSHGFVGARAGIGLLTERELYGSPRPRPARRRFRGVPVDNLVALRPGDHVVHVDYGVGVFEGTRRVRHEAVEKDYLTLRYAAGDRVFVPVENLGLVDRYVGSGREAPALDRIGGRSWLLAKARAARASLDYAGELVEISARRALARGHTFAPDGEWHRELAAAFPFTETPDQAWALETVRQDMERGRPMERLVCGDVGYGKTEVALRAAFKAAAGLKQVAVLVPTTILCWQHFDTFRRRLAPFPFRVEMISRLVPPTARHRVLDDIAAGRVDIVIATHSLLSTAPRFRDLGLLIVDEEQKFGVRQKERIKALRAGVDVLSLSATPVPRTLYLALVGLRDISTIHTPPPGRREVLTEVAPWDDALITRYLERELDRNGQVFFVHNRIQTLGIVERRLRRLLPGLDIATAHGRMPARRLEDLYLEFATGRHPVLLSTAIIESGVDLPNVNTIIVDRADTFGLADLHQLRGRVGRSGRQAHALFLTPSRADITPEARKRLSALVAYSRLGSGFRLALRDLEIRGAGDLLGTRQHGQVARVGLNLYARMIREASSRLRGEEPAAEPELSLELNAFMPESYVPEAFERVALYRRLLGLESEEELRGFEEELVDRFGRYPPVVADLFRIALVRIRARKLGLLKVSARAGLITITGPDRTETLRGGITELLDRLCR